MSEQNTNPEAVNEMFEQNLILLLREKGPQDAEVMAMFGKWRDAREAAEPRVDENSARDIRIQIDGVKLYIQAGHVEFATQLLYDEEGIYDEAYLEGLDDLCDEILALLDSIGYKRER